MVRQLQKELDAVNDFSYEKLAGVKTLNAVIDETLRMHPPVPSGAQRVTPKDGMSIGDTYIPGDVLVQVPWHNAFRGHYFQ